MIHQQKIQRLGFFEEAVGVLTELTEDEGFLNEQIGKVVLLLPPEMENTLRPLLGTRIGILRTDIPRKEYLVRRIAGGKSPVLEEVGSIRQTFGACKDCEIREECLKGEAKSKLRTVMLHDKKGNEVRTG